jgi:hypothetical protein
VEVEEYHSKIDLLEEEMENDGTPWKWSTW